MKKKLALLALIASTSEAEPLEESFIDIIFKKDFYSFSQVMMDEDENPYISLNHLAEWSGMDIVCFEEICSLKYLNEQVDISFSENKVYRNGESIDIKSDEYSYQDNQYWIRYDAINRSLPYTVNWSVQSYEIFISPVFKLKGERIEENKRQIEQGRKNVKKPEDEVKVIEAKENLDNQFMASFKNTVSKDSATSTLRLENITDVNGGTLYMGAIITDGDVDKEWSYETYTNKNFEYIRFGSGNTPEKSALASKSSETTFYFDKIETSEATNRFTLETQVRANSIVDLYINGFFIKTVEVDEFGKIYEENIKGSPGDRVTLRVYGTDGSYNEIPYSIGGDSSYMLSKGEVDYEIYGDVDYNTYSLSGSYGITDGMTFGVLYESMDDTDFIEANMTYQHNYWSVMRAKLSENYLFGSLDLRYFEKSPVYIEYLDVKEQIQGLKYQDSYTKVEQNWGMGRLSNENSITFYDDSYYLDNILRYKLDFKKTLVLQNTYDSSALYEKNTTFIQINETINESGSWDLGYEFTDQSKLIKASLKYKYTDLFDSLDKDSYFTMSANHDGNDLYYTANLDWTFGDYLTGNVSVGKETFSVGLEFALTRSSNEDRVYGKDKFGKATIDGYLLADNLGETSPIQDVRMTIGGDTVTTDENGYYSFTEVPSNSIVNMHINESDLDIDLALTGNDIPMETRPATKIKHNILVKPVVGIDGYVFIDNATGVVIVNESFDYSQEIELDRDGFFTHEGIPAAKDYKFRAIDEEKDIIKEITINLDEEYWYSDITIE